jgi:oligopeptide transport system substrate-binding protein
MKKIALCWLALCLIALGACDQPVVVDYDDVILETIPAARPTFTATAASGTSVRLRLGIFYEPVLDPSQAADWESAFLVNQLFQSLVTTDPNTGAPVPELAESWSISEDGLIYNFTLRKDQVWSNGRPVTSDDVVYAIRRVINPANEIGTADTLFLIANAEHVNNLGTATQQDLESIGVERLDDFTVRFTLQEPAAYFPSLLTLPVAKPVPAEAIEAYGEDWVEPGNIITNGSFKLEAWEHQDHLLLVRNGGEPQEVIEIKTGLDPSLSLAAFQAGEVDIIQVSPNMLPQLLAEPSLHEYVRTGDTLCTYLYAFNTSKSPFDSAQVRLAFVQSVDRYALTEMLFNGLYRPAKNLAPAGFFGSPALDPDFEALAFNPERAIGFLKEAGYASGADLPEINLYYWDNGINGEIAHILTQSWRGNLGAEVQEIGEPDLATYLQQRNDGVPNIFYYRYCGIYPDENDMLLMGFHSTKGYNRIRWSNPEFDQLVERATRESEPSMRLASYYQAEYLLCNREAVILPLYHEQYVFLVRPPLEPLFDMTFGLRDLKRW